MAEKKHKNYHTVKLLIEGNQLKEFREIFDHLPKTTVNRDLGINYNRFTRLLKSVQGFKLEELYMLAHLIGIEEKTILELAHAQYLADKAIKRKK